MAAHLTPMQVCEALIGRPERIAAAIGINQKSPYHWRSSRTGRMAGDLPSADIMRRLLAYSEKQGLGLKPEHLIRGASVGEVAEILAARDRQSEFRQPPGEAA